MSLSRYLIFMIVATCICWAAWYTVVMIVNPQDGGIIGLSLFYSSLLFALTGSFAVAGFFTRLVLLKQELIFQKVAISFRQGFFFALLVNGFLILQHLRLLTWYNVSFLIIGLTIAEFFVISRRPVRHRS